MNLVVACSLDCAIGNKGNLLCHVPEDMKRFKELTTGNVVIMGQKTLESLPGGKPLPNRDNVVLTFDKNYYVEGADVVHDKKELFDLLNTKYKNREHWIIGGASIYNQFYKYCSKAYVTWFDLVDREADARIVDFETLADWNLIDDEPWLLSKKGIMYQFCIYENENVNQVD